VQSPLKRAAGIGVKGAAGYGECIKKPGFLSDSKNLVSWFFHFKSIMM
jgi:hypothetical protein